MRRRTTGSKMIPCTAFLPVSPSTSFFELNSLWLVQLHPRLLPFPPILIIRTTSSLSPSPLSFFAVFPPQHAYSILDRSILPILSYQLDFVFVLLWHVQVLLWRWHVHHRRKRIVRYGYRLGRRKQQSRETLRCRGGDGYRRRAKNE
jgi:hypothetical protein